MDLDLQKAGLWKRITAWLFDSILMCGIVVAIVCLLVGILPFNSYNQAFAEALGTYGTEYGVSFGVDAGDYQALTEQQKEVYDNAYNALIADENAMHAYNMMIVLAMIIATLAILFAYVMLEFLLPLLFGNGQTIGKKISNIGLVCGNGVKVTTLQLFIRTFAGKFLIETMIPVYLIILIFFGSIGFLGSFLLGVILLVQIILLAGTRNHTVIHDMLGKTAVVDINSQIIFRDTDELMAYQRKIREKGSSWQDD